MFKRFKHLNYAGKVSLVVLSWVPVVYLIPAYVCSISQIKGSSMSPTINPIEGDSSWVIVWKWRFRKNLKIDDVILLMSPIDPEKRQTKRVKGIQGDTIIARYPYPKEKVSISRNHLWLEGDNVHSIDSNYYGPVSSAMALGKITHIIYPFGKFSKIPEGGRECRESKIRYLE